MRDDKINQIIPTLLSEMQTDDANESAELLDYYLSCDAEARAVVDNVLLFLCGWKFETLLKKCGIDIAKEEEPF